MWMFDVADIIANIVTALGVPWGIWIFWAQRQNERRNDEKLIYESLSSSYEDYLRQVIQNADLRLWSDQETGPLSAEQQERHVILLDLLVSLFERAYILTYAEDMSAEQARRWAQWENYMRQWCRRDDFRKNLELLLDGDDPRFVSHILKVRDQVDAEHSGQAN